ncbi:MAG: hypothetical protein P8Z80_18000 [Pseudolabrys sp.]
MRRRSLTGDAAEDRADGHADAGQITLAEHVAGHDLAGGVLGKGYLAGIGMTIGTVFGRIAGEGAAAHANN